MEIKIGDIFTNDEHYSERAEWCNNNGCYIEEIEKDEEGNRQFQIKEIEIVEPTLEEVKANKLKELSELTDKIFNSSETYLTSSLGFRINARSKALEDINSLIVLGDEITYFNDFDDTIHELNVRQLEILQKEVIRSGQSIYNQKWNYRKQIEDSETVDEIKAIKFNFVFSDFSI